MRFSILALPLALIFCGLCAPGAAAQEATLAFKGLRAGAGQPVEITADMLAVNQKDATATFTGNVLVIQGELRLSADEMLVVYVEGDKAKIDRLLAKGSVLFATGSEAAEAETATYSLTTSEFEMAGNVLLTQGDSVISGQKLIVDLESGTGRMEGRVKTILQPGGN